MAEERCPNCGNPINDDDALLCLYCGNSLKRKIGFMGKMKYAIPTIILIFVIGLLISCFIGLFIR